MKQFLITLLAVGVLASAAQAEARLVSKRGECVAACGQAISDGCGWITKRGKFNRCRAKLINQCKRFGTDAMCPPPATPPVTTPTTLPVVTTTTLPVVTPTTLPVVVTTTTTTVPYIPPTTTTLPPPIPFVAMSVDGVDSVYCNGYPGQKVWVTVCAGGGAFGLSLNPVQFLFTQGGVSSIVSTCHYDYRHTTACSSSTYVNSDSCYSCSLVFDRAYTGNPRDLYYLTYGLDGLKYEVDVAF